MTTPATTDRAKAPLEAIVACTLRTALPGRRWIGVLLPCVAAVLFGLLVRSTDGIAEEDFARVGALALFGLVLPVTCLVVGDAVLGADLRSGSFAFTWLSPVPAWQIVLGRWLGGSIVAAGCLSVAFALAGTVAGASTELSVAAALAGAVGSIAYVAVFIAIGCFARRAAVWSLAFVFLVERLLGAALSGIAQLSPSWVARAAFLDLGDAQASLVRDGIPQGTAALVRLGVIAAVALALATTRLRRLTFAGSAD